MTIWLVKDGENLPLQDGARPQRTWMLADELVRRGHRVVWWTSTFFHPHKSLLAEGDRRVPIAPGFELRLVHAGRYRHNVSFGRYVHNLRWGRRLRAAWRADADRPDAIVTAFPIIDSAWHAVEFGREIGVPVIVDVRDMWPETFLDVVPWFLRTGMRWALRKDFRRTRELLADASALVSISDGVFGWALRMSGEPRAARTIIRSGYPDRGAPVRRAPAAPFRLLYIGSFGRSYELKQICEVAKRLDRSAPGKFEFVLTGRGEQFDSLQRRYGAVPSIRWDGWLNAAQIREELETCHVGIIPGPLVPNAFPNKTFEYMSAGMPLLSCLPGELEREIVGEGVGWQYPVGDVDALERVVRELAANPTGVRNTGMRARQLYERRYRSQDLYLRYADLVEQTARTAPPAVSSPARYAPAVLHV